MLGKLSKRRIKWIKKGREMKREKSKREKSSYGKMCWLLLKREMTLLLCNVPKWQNDSITMEV